MYAIIESGSKQLRLQAGDIIQVEKLDGEKGSSIVFDKVLFFSKPSEGSSQTWLGKPLLNSATVQGEIVGQGRGDKIMIVKKRRRKNYRRTQGHRQFYTQVLITEINNGSGESSKLSSDQIQKKKAGFSTLLAPKGQPHTLSLSNTPKANRTESQKSKRDQKFARSTGTEMKTEAKTESKPKKAATSAAKSSTKTKAKKKS